MESLLGSATILVVEDEEQVRSLIVRMLEKRGYRVLQAANGRRALEVAVGNIGDIDLVVTDVVMPEMGGIPLIRELHKLRSGLPFLCMTGYTQDEVAGSEGFDDRNLIEKPFSPATFLDRVQSLINGAASSSS
jgi:two-component system, cell cycle sensor histidine kinase and response regulator CckA